MRVLVADDQEALSKATACVKVVAAGIETVPT
jgi:hypothetical protein